MVQSNAVPPPVKERTKHELSQDARQAKCLLKRLHTPQHRSPQVNHTLSSIMKMPKYSSQVSFDLDAELVQDNCAQERGIQPLLHLLLPVVLTII
jgi:hypothetical protein